MFALDKSLHLPIKVQMLRMMFLWFQGLLGCKIHIFLPFSGHQRHIVHWEHHRLSSSHSSPISQLLCCCPPLLSLRSSSCLFCQEILQSTPVHLPLQTRSHPPFREYLCGFSDDQSADWQHCYTSPALASERALWLWHWESWGLSSFYEYWTRSRHHQTQIRGSLSS